MRLNEKNCNYTIVKTKFCGGGVVSFHLSLESALRERSRLSNHSKYPYMDIVPMNRESKDKMIEYNFNYYNQHKKHILPPDEFIKLFFDLPLLKDAEHWLDLCL